MKPTLGVFGYGQFMEFFTPYLHDYFDVVIYDRNQKNTQSIRDIGATPANLEITARCDFVLLGYPTSYIPQLIDDISDFLQVEAIVFDICSIKTPPVESMLAGLVPTNHIIATHPIFGPQSGKNGIKGLTMTISNVRCDQKKFQDFCRIFSHGLELNVVDISPEQHDKEMAYIQGITHFIGRALKDIEIPNSELATTSYLHLMEAKEMVGNDSDALFLSIQSDNPFIGDVRKKLLTQFEKLQTWIQSQK